MNYPKVYIVILNWNGLKDTLECLESVYKLEYPNFEVIVVDNASTDHSTTVIPKMYPNATLITNEENLGYTGGNNIAMRYAMGHDADYIWLLNNDTVVEPDSLGKLVAEGESFCDTGLISPVIYCYDQPDKIQHCGGFAIWKNQIMYTIESLEAWKDNNLSIPPGKVMILYGTALLVKRRIVECIGYLDEKYFAYGEDVDYSTRVVKAGYRNRLCQQVKVYHKKARSTGGESSPLRVFLRIRNKYFLWMRNLNGFQKCLYPMRYLADGISQFAILSDSGLNESADACFDGMYCAFRNVGGPRNGTFKMPNIVKKAFLWHPYLWVELLKGNFLQVFLEISKRIKNKICTLFR